MCPTGMLSVPDSLLKDVSIGVMSWFFSRPVFTPLCRLSYCMFLVSLPLQALAAARPHKIHYDHFTAVIIFLSMYNVIIYRLIDR